MFELLETAGILGIIITIVLIIITIALVYSILEMRKRLEHIDNTITAIAERKYGIHIIEENKQNNDDDYQLLG